MELNYIKFQGVDCVYHKKDKSMVLIPKNPDERFNYREIINKKDFMIEYASTIYNKSYAFVKNVSFTENRAIRFNILYYVSMVENEGINEIQLTGDEIDTIFHPASYFFKKADDFKKNPVDLIYGNHIGEEYNIKYKGENISIVLSYGDIFERGTASDLKLHAKLSVLFEETNNVEKVHDLIMILTKFIQLISHQVIINLKPISIFGNIDKRRAKLGLYYSELYELKKINAFPFIHYDYFKPHIGKLLQFTADNQNLNLNFYPKDVNQSYSYDIERFLAICAAFENECNKKLDIYGRIMKNSSKAIKEDLLKLVGQLGDNKQTYNNEDRNFLNLAKDRISQLGTQFGQRKKIVNAYNQNINILEGSIEFILPKTLTVGKASERLAELRNKIVHGNFHTIFDREEIAIIRFLEILTYVMLFKRAGVKDEGIEILIGVVYHCNIKYTSLPDS